MLILLTDAENMRGKRDIMPTFGKVLSKTEFRQLSLLTPEKPAPPRPVYTEGMALVERRPPSDQDQRVQAAVETCDIAHATWCSAWNSFSPKEVCDELWSAYIEAYEVAQNWMRELYDFKIPTREEFDIENASHNG
jgi:hypothetical protein